MTTPPRMRELARRADLRGESVLARDLRIRAAEIEHGQDDKELPTVSPVVRPLTSSSAGRLMNGKRRHR